MTRMKIFPKTSLDSPENIKEIIFKKKRNKHFEPKEEIDFNDPIIYSKITISFENPEGTIIYRTTSVNTTIQEAISMATARFRA